MEAIFCGGTWESQKEVCFVAMTRVFCDIFFSMRWHDALDPRFSWGSLCSHFEWTCWVTRWHFLHIFEQGDWALAGQMFMCNRLGSACKARKSPQITSIWFSTCRGLPMKTHLLGLSQEGGRVQAKHDVCWISGSWIFIPKDYEALKTKLKGSTNRSNGFFVALKCFEMVCIKWIKCVFLPLVAFYRVWVSQRVWVDIPR